MAENTSAIINTAYATQLHHVNMSNVTKLPASNFLMWGRQIRALLAGYGLAGYLGGTMVGPASTVLRAGTSTPNPEYDLWQRQDQLIVASLLGVTSVLVSRFDQLATLGKPYEHEEQIEYLLGGLPEDYMPIVDQIEGRDTPPTMPTIHEKLMNYDLKLHSQVSATSVVLVTANAAFNKSYGQSNNPLSGFHSWFPTVGWHYTPSLGSQGSPHANAAAIPPYNRANWVMDSGATHHLTSDLSNLSLHQLYSGGEEVQIADGTGLKITHTGSALLPTPSSSLALKDVLYVPDLCTNLISVYCLCNAHKVFVEFYPAYFQVRDLSTGVTPSPN
ncbi:PREDICTED: uncharacterized protein LOC104753571 [Camelina sativa]|uniref:Uncharacterized protein LOC104753571 n=1 Tax=Camelina sativa TaxID=90675 RepID=A0ABM0WPC6_CAMSA|nr:PREDICTED: uncharacterized protein LOC104753571 [Camelina sativa]